MNQPSPAVPPAGAGGGDPTADGAAGEGRPSTLAGALAAGPRRYLTSVWPWRALLWTLQLPWAGGAVVGAAAALWAATVESDLSPLGRLAAGVPLALLVVLTALAVGAWQRHAVRLVGLPAVWSGHRPDPGPVLPWPERVWTRVRLLATEPATARDLLYGVVAVGWSALCLLVQLLALVVVTVLVMLVLWAVTGNPELRPVVQVVRDGDVTWLAAALGPVILLATPYLLGWLALGGARIAAAVMAPPPDVVRSQITELLAARRRLSDAFDVERRRIERDLHDGAQQRIVAQAMTLGSAAVELAALGPQAADALRLVDQARAENRRILAELRDLVRGIHPQVLTDHGLLAAMEEVAARSTVPVQLRVALRRRLPEPVEAAAYFAVLEALTNAARHAAARSVVVTGRMRGSWLFLRVEDDGRGGAELRPGGGLSGLVERVAALGGRLTVSSPVGGPTVVAVTLPCGPDLTGVLDQIGDRDLAGAGDQRPAGAGDLDSAGAGDPAGAQRRAVHDGG